MSSRRPLIGISAGDPAGIGPEVTVKALNNPEMYTVCRPLIIADDGVIQHTVQLLQTHQTIHTAASPDQGQYVAGTLDVLDLRNINDYDSYRIWLLEKLACS